MHLIVLDTVGGDNADVGRRLMLAGFEKTFPGESAQRFKIKATLSDEGSFMALTDKPAKCKVYFCGCAQCSVFMANMMLYNSYGCNVFLIEDLIWSPFKSAIFDNTEILKIFGEESLVKLTTLLSENV